MPKSGPLDKQATKARIIGWIVEGKSRREVAALVSTKRRRVTHQAITAFCKRYADEIERLQSRAADVVEDLAISRKEERVRRLDEIYNRLHDFLEQRGITAREPKWLTVYIETPAGQPQPTNSDGDPLPVKQQPDGSYLTKLGERLVEVERLDAALIQQLRGVLADVAEEQGERVKVKIDNRKQIITLEALDALLEGGD